VKVVEAAIITDFYLFLVSVIFISFSGVMMPGPLLAVTIDKASKSKTVGPLVAFGHGVIEFPLMFLIYFGVTQLLAPEVAQVSIGLLGGSVMLYMGVETLRNRKKTNQEYEGSKHGSLIAGILATGGNPFFLVWWLTIGAGLVMNAKGFGLMGFSIFAVTHWFCDFIWYTFVALVVFKSQRFWTRKVNLVVSTFCFAVLMGFGIWFITSALWILISTLT